MKQSRRNEGEAIPYSLHDLSEGFYEANEPPAGSVSGRLKPVGDLLVSGETSQALQNACGRASEVAPVSLDEQRRRALLSAQLETMRYRKGNDDFHCRYPFRESDVLLASYPRSGNTWIRAVLSYILARLNGEREVDDLRRLDRYAPSIYKGNLDQIAGGRIIKTHSRHFPNFNRTRKCIYVLRDGRDAAVSYFHWKRMMVKGFSSTPFSDFLKYNFLGQSDIFSPWQEHVMSWIFNPSILSEILVVTYQELKDRTMALFQEITGFLELPCEPDLIAEAVEMCSLERLRKKEKDRPEEFAQAINPKLDRTGSFFRRGETGTYRELFSESDLNLFYTVCGDLMTRLGFLTKAGGDWDARTVSCGPAENKNQPIEVGAGNGPRGFEIQRIDAKSCSSGQDSPIPQFPCQGRPSETQAQLARNVEDPTGVPVKQDCSGSPSQGHSADLLFELEDGTIWKPPNPPLAPEIIESASLERAFLDNLTVAELTEREGRKRMLIKPITDSAPYKLLSGNTIAYLEYTKRFGTIKSCIERFNELQRRIEEKGYPHDHEYICVYENENTIRDGRHRAAILRHRYGNIEVPVIRFRTKVPFPRWERGKVRPDFVKENEPIPPLPARPVEQGIEQGGLVVEPLQGAEAFI